MRERARDREKDGGGEEENHERKSWKKQREKERERGTMNWKRGGNSKKENLGRKKVDIRISVSVC